MSTSSSSSSTYSTPGLTPPLANDPATAETLTTPIKSLRPAANNNNGVAGLAKPTLARAGSSDGDTALANGAVDPTTPFELTEHVERLLDELERRLESITTDVLDRLSQVVGKLDGLEQLYNDMADGLEDAPRLPPRSPAIQSPDRPQPT
ncbi:hypothetical protein E5Q_05765 [Mixia osmundae IAM 14324]|uniref:Uncharacterized protein n=1 Tax=Mixia osmundae (strain CBS 9802 / IAM 14324 / JCM 22182 / KY 12970) TaxID=764103 RepID=G7E8B6_MIXOS|nr:hypothetical protein E5Q_05765 [Mixia osmundae IAM 14324]